MVRKEDGRIDFEKLTFPFRYITGPVVVLTGALIGVSVYFYCKDAQSTKDSFTEIKTSQTAIFQKLDDSRAEEMQYRERIGDKLAEIRSCCKERIN